MRPLALLCLLIGMASLGLSSRCAQASDLTIVPGERIGGVHLGELLSHVEKRLGETPIGDGAVGHHWRTWEARSVNPQSGIRHSLDVYAENGADNGPYVRIIRVTSPQFHTRDGLAPGSTLTKIQRRYPHLTRIARYMSPQFHTPVMVYETSHKGIAFEVRCDAQGHVHSSSRCLAVLVHSPSLSSVNAVYSSTTGYLAWEQQTRSSP